MIYSSWYMYVHIFVLYTLQNKKHLNFILFYFCKLHFSWKVFAAYFINNVWVNYLGNLKTTRELQHRNTREKLMNNTNVNKNIQMVFVYHFVFLSYFCLSRIDLWVFQVLVILPLSPKLLPVRQSSVRFEIVSSLMCELRIVHYLRLFE